MPETYTLSRVAKTTGVRPRTLQFWTSSGVIKPEEKTLHGGPGTHRRYPEREVVIAAIIAELNAFSVQIGTLRSFANYLRLVLSVGDDYGFESPEAASEAIEVDRLRQVPKDKRTKRAKALGLSEVPTGQPVFTRDERLRLMAWAAFEEARVYKADTVILFRVKPDGQWESEVAHQQIKHGSTPSQPMDLLGVNWPSFLVISLMHIYPKLDE